MRLLLTKKRPAGKEFLRAQRSAKMIEDEP
jgi:hypothetical protein